MRNPLMPWLWPQPQHQTPGFPSYPHYSNNCAIRSPLPMSCKLTCCSHKTYNNWIQATSGHSKRTCPNQLKSAWPSPISVYHCRYWPRTNPTYDSKMHLEQSKSGRQSNQYCHCPTGRCRHSVSNSQYPSRSGRKVRRKPPKPPARTGISPRHNRPVSLPLWHSCRNA